MSNGIQLQRVCVMRFCCIVLLLTVVLVRSPLYADEQAAKTVEVLSSTQQQQADRPAVSGVWIAIAVLLAAGGVGIWIFRSAVWGEDRRSPLWKKRASRHQKEAALFESCRELSGIMENLPLVVYRVRRSPEQSVEYISRGCLNQTGYTAEDFLSGRIVWQELIVPEDRTRFREGTGQGLQHRKTYQIEYRIITRQGRTAWVLDKGEGLYDKNGNLFAQEGFVLDISERKRVQETLRFTQFAVDHAGEAAFWMDANGKIIYVNEATCQLLGYTREELLQKTIPELDPNFPEQKWPRHWAETREKGSTRIETRHRAKNGELIPVEININYVCYEGREYHCSFARDIRERKKAEQAREKLMRELQSKNEELESIVFIASHDLRSPLVNIRGFTGELEKALDRLEKLLAEEPLTESGRQQLKTVFSEEISEALDFIKSGGGKMDTLLNGLLRLSRAGRTEVQPTQVEMNPFLEGIINTLRFRIRQTDIHITVDDELPPCIGDPVLLNQVFMNLIDNAMKYRSPDRDADIHISGESRDKTVVYCVRDNGIGIAPDHVDKVFEIFHRLNPENGEDGEGLGLTIVRRLLKRQNGDVWIESEPDAGTSVFVELPKA